MVALVLFTAGVTALALGAAKPAPTAVVTAASTPTPIKKEFVPHLLVIGDSFTGGSKEGGDGAKGWAALVQSSYTKSGARLQLDLLGRGGAGYATKGQINETFIESYKANPFANEDVMVVFGGLNDTERSADDVGTAASLLYAEMRKNSPKAPLIVVGPAWPNSVPVPNIYKVRDAIKAAALAAGATFIDPIEQGWFSGDRQAMIGSDKTHPTDAGHKFMADQLAPVILAEVKKAAAANS
jgi:lysophospholipase L1-like esterase